MITSTDGSGEHDVALHGVAVPGSSGPGGSGPKTTPGAPKRIVLRHLSVRPRHLPLRGSRSVRITVRFVLSAAARIRFTIGRRVAGSPNAVPLLGAHVVRARAGHNRVRFTLRWAGGHLGAGTYTLALAPEGRAGTTRHTRLLVGR